MQEELSLNKGKYSDQRRSKKIFFKVAKYFKRECSKYHFKKRIYPISFGINVRDSLKFSERTNDFFVGFGQLKTGLRRRVSDLSREQTLNSRYKFSIHSSLNPESYYAELSRSRVAVDCFGGGEMNFRRFEILAFGTCLLAEKSSIIYPAPFIHGKHLFEFSTVAEFQYLLDYLLKNPSVAEEDGNNGRNLLSQRYTPNKIAEYLLEMSL